MGINTKPVHRKVDQNKVLDRRSKIAELKKKHAPLFEKEGVEFDKAKFIPKMAYIPRGKEEHVVSFFPSELRGGMDIYTEFTSSSWEPEDSQRRLWKWPYNPHYETEYEVDNSKANQDPRYLIPIDELIDVAVVHTEQVAHIDDDIQEELDFDSLPDPDNDSPMSEMTMRDECAIRWKVPVSRKKWLNELIKQTFKQK